MITKDMLEVINRILRSPKTVLTPIFGEKRDETATQMPKPSPSSPYAVGELMKRARKAYPEHDCVAKFVSHTPSMSPYCAAGDVVVLKEFKHTNPVRVGEVMTYQFNELLVMHRVVEIQGSRVRMKGDNNFFSDGWIEDWRLKHSCIAVLHGTKP